MLKLFSKKHLSALLALLSLSTMNASLITDECCYSPECNRLYIGGFGGGLYSNSSKLYQMGTAFFTETQGGALAVHAFGRSDKSSSGFGGAQIGYEWSERPLQIGCSNWSLSPAAEVEAFFYSHTKQGHLINHAGRLDEHDFLDTFPMDMSVLLINSVFSLNNPCLGGFSPYVGGGIGATHISLRDADSLQTVTPEPGINHFNSKRGDTTWAFAAQAKAGLRYTICKSLHLFAEYRYLFIDCSNYILGSTVYPATSHVDTSPWNVKIENINYSAFAFGIQYDLF